MTDQQEIAEQQMDDSNYIPNYLSGHAEQVKELREAATKAQFEGKWILIGDKGYDDAREQYATTSFNEADVSPGVILFPAVGKYNGVADIKKAVKMCKQLGIHIAVRCGGHQYCGYSSTSSSNMQIDVSQCFPEYEYDKANNVLTCGVSHALGDWAKLNNDQGIYLPMGVCSNVHLGGHVHTGGWGIVGRSHGLLADHVLQFNMILANGVEKTVYKPVKDGPGKTDQSNDDLFFAVLGGSKGGDFGIVTHWTFEPLVDAHYPNSACYNLTWLWSRERMLKATALMQEYSKFCANGLIPGDYEFMMTITGTGTMNFLPTLVADGFEKLDPDQRNALFNEVESTILDVAKKLDIELDITMPPLIQLWLCYTNKDGASAEFDSTWFDRFEKELGDTLGPLTQRNQQTPVSLGILNQFIMHADREMEYPFVKRSRVTMEVPDEFPEAYTDRMYKIMNFLTLPVGTNGGQHLVSQQQIYAGGMIAKYGGSGDTAYSWRDQAYALSHDSFYNVAGLFGDNLKDAETWQRRNDRTFVSQQKFAEKDMRMFAYTFGNRDLEEVWQYYYDSKEKYDRLKDIKKAVDPTGLFTADEFSVEPDDFESHL